MSPPARPPAPTALPFLRLRPTPPERHTAILIALERRSKLRDIVVGHHEHLFFFRFVASLERVRIEKLREAALHVERNNLCARSRLFRTLSPAGKPGRDAATPRSTFPRLVMGGRGLKTVAEISQTKKRERGGERIGNRAAPPFSGSIASDGLYKR